MRGGGKVGVLPPFGQPPLPLTLPPWKLGWGEGQDDSQVICIHLHGVRALEAPPPPGRPPHLSLRDWFNLRKHLVGDL